jgi:cytochrome c oxidase cbb3-type subunit 2
VKNNFIFFLGLVAALGLSWAGIVLGSNAQLGGLAPYYDDSDQTTYPQWLAGQAARGQLVYKDLGCVACHTQQVRRPGFGSDQERGWGDRQSVARDYIYQPFPQLGSSRLGPDLANVGDRKPTPPDAVDFLTLLYKGSGGMPSYRFLFEKRRIGVDAQPSQAALQLTGSLKPADGWEIVPTTRATALAAYLVNLKNPYTYPEAAPAPVPKAEGEKAPSAVPPAPASHSMDANADLDKTSPSLAPGGTPVALPVVVPNEPTPSPTTAVHSATNEAAPPAPADAKPASPAPTPGAAPAPGAGATPGPTPTPAAALAAGATPAPSVTPTPGANSTQGVTPAPSVTPTPGATAAPAATPTPAGGSK